MRRNAELESRVTGLLKGCTSIGSKVIWYDCLDSTIDYAKQHSDTLIDGTVIVAEKQKKGRGRYGRVWHSPQGGLWVSYYLYNPELRDNPGALSIVAAVSAHKAMSSYLPCSIKWVNDILHNGQKIAGSLVEGDTNYLVVGMGLNTNVDDFNITLEGKGVPEFMKGRNLADIATSVKLEKGEEVDNILALAKLSKEFDSAYLQLKQGNMKEMLAYYNSNCDSIGRNVAVYRRNERLYDADAKEVNSMGRLVVEKQDGNLVTLIDEEIFYS